MLLGVPGVAQAQGNQITVWLERESASVHEGEASGFGIYLSDPPNTLPNSDDDDFTDASGQFKIPLVATPFGGARSGIDFHGPGTAKFYPHETRTGLGVWAHEDDRVEEGHGVVVTFGTLPDGVILAEGKPTTMTVMFIDGPSGPKVSLAVNPSTISENGRISTVTASLTKVHSADVTVAVGADPMDPAVAGDFTLSPNRTLTIAAGSKESTGVVRVTAVDNLDGGPSKTILIKGSLGGGTTGVGAPNAVSLTITDDEVESTSIALSVAPTAVSEGAGTTSVTVTATLNSLPRDAATEVSVSVAGGTATAGTDFATVDSFTLTIEANATSGTATFDLTPTDDSAQEDTETITVSGTNDDGLTVSAATLNITDNDAPQYSLTVNPSTIDEDDGTTTVTASTGGTTYLTDRTITLSFGGTATKGTDYSVDDETLTLTAGLTSVSTTVRATDDVLTESNETIEITATLDSAQFGAQQTVTITDDETASTQITLSLEPANVAEDAGETDVTVTGTLDGGAFTTSTNVTVTVAGGTATAGTDFTAVGSFTLTIEANATSGTATFDLTPTDDSAQEDTETITVSGTNDDGLTVSAATLNITDNDAPQYSLTVNPSTIDEDDGTTTVTASTGGTTYLTDRTITLSFGGTATKGTDYSVDDETLTLTAGLTSVSTTVRATDDVLTESNETIEITATLDSAQFGAQQTVTITDDETASTQITLSLEPANVAEDAGETDVTVTGTLDGGAFTTSTNVTVTVAGGTATAGTDFTAVGSFTLTIEANATSGTATFDLTPTDDSAQEDTETITVSGTNDDGLTVSAATLNITDNDAPQYSLTVNPSTIDEDDGTTTVTASTGGTTYLTDRTITLSFGGTATKGTDYSVDDETLTLTAGLTSVSTTVRATDDVLTESNETIEITATLDSAQFGAQQTVTITDDETASTQITLSLEPANVAEDAGETDVTVTGTLDGGAFTTSTNVTVTVAGGTATAGTDFTAVGSFTLTIEANATSGTATFDLTPTDDSAQEDTETITVSGTNDDGLTVSAATLNITDNDAPQYSLTVNPSTIDEDDGTTTVTASTGGTTYLTDRTITLSFGGTATKGTDYSVDDETLTLTAGLTSVSTTVRAVDDTMTDPDETIEITGTLDGDQIGVKRTVTIADDETAASRITLSVNPAAVAEDAGATDIMVTGTLNGAAQSTAVEVEVSVASGTATAGADFTAVASFTLEIDANETSGEATFRFTPTNDTLAEDDETVRVSGTTTAADLTVWAATLEITDNDAPKYTLAVSPASISESDGTASVTVSTGGATFSEDQTFTLSFGGSATKGTDYSVDDESLTLTAGQTSVSTTVRAVDDEDADPDETIEITAALNGVTVGTTQTLTITDGSTLTSTDDDTASTQVSLSVAPAAVAEDAGATNVTVTGRLNGAALSTPTSVTVSVVSGTATAGSDFAAVASFPLTIAANATSGTATFSLAPTDDSLVEDVETVKVSGSTGGDLTILAATLEITDDDEPSYALAVNPATIAETDGVSTVTVSTGGVGFPADRTIALGFGGTATKGTDYSVDAEALTLTAGQTSVSTTVRAVDDEVMDPDETIDITATLDGEGIGTTQTVTIVDDDTAATRVTLTVAPATVAEDAGATVVTVTGTLNGAAPGTATEVTVSVASGTATAGRDFAAVASFPLRIAANETSGTATFSLTPTDDSLVEDTETVKVSGSAGDDLTVLAAKLSITDDDEPSYALAVNPASIVEVDGTSTVTVRTGGVILSEDQTIVLGFGGTATRGADYSVDADSLTLTAGQTTVSTTVRAVDDAVTDPDETIEITATLGGEQIGTTQTVTIVDDTSGKQPNRPPTAVDDRVETAEDTPVLIDVIANDTDPDGDTLRLVAVMAPAHGTATVVAGGMRYVPEPDYHGPDRFTYRVADSSGEMAAASVAVTVLPVNDAPLAVGSIPTQQLEEGGPPATLEVAPYFEDADDEVLTYQAESSDQSVTTVTVAGSTLTLTAVVTGNTAVTVTATDAAGLAATQTFGVAVGDTLVKAVMTDALAALGRGYLSSVQMTLERRMDARNSQPRATVAGQPLPLGATDLAAMPSGTMQRWQMATLAAQQRGATSPAARAAAAIARQASDQAFGSGLGPSRGDGQLLQGTELLLAFGEESPAAAGERRWTVWGQGDIQTFQGGPDGQENIDGWLRTAYLGLDAQLGPNWLAGVAVARSGGTGKWQTGPAVGRLTTALTAVHPYVRWGGQDTSVSASLGVGRGTAANVRAVDHRRETSSLGLGLGLIEARRRLGAIGGGVELGLRGEASWARLSTGAGYESLDALRASVYRGRVGVEATRNVQAGLVTLTPFGALSARQDGGAGQTGTGLELAGGLRMRGGRVRLVAQGRMLALHSATGYQERGASLTASVGAGPYQRGLALSVTPRWGASASGADTLWQDQFYRYTDGAAPFDQGIDARGSYGLGVADDRFLLAPFAAYGRIGDGERLQVGTTLGALGAAGGGPVEFELSGERYRHGLRGADHRFSLLGILTFGGAGTVCGEQEGCGLPRLGFPVTGTTSEPDSAAGADGP